MMFFPSLHWNYFPSFLYTYIYIFLFSSSCSSLYRDHFYTYIHTGSVYIHNILFRALLRRRRIFLYEDRSYFIPIYAMTNLFLRIDHGCAKSVVWRESNTTMWQCTGCTSGFNSIAMLPVVLSIVFIDVKRTRMFTTWYY